MGEPGFRAVDREKEGCKSCPRSEKNGGYLCGGGGDEDEDPGECNVGERGESGGEPGGVDAGPK